MDPSRSLAILPSRRRFLGGSLGLATNVACLHWVSGTAAAADLRSANSRPSFAAIGTGRPVNRGRGGRGTTIAQQATKFANLVAICDVDRVSAERANLLVGGGHCDLTNDYREVLDRTDIDAVLVSTPDHWHVKIAIEAIRAGKDVYCEKPLTLTIDEGHQICRAVRDTGRVVQVGTQQRSEFNERFLTAVALVQQGRIGRVRRIEVGLNRGEDGGPFAVAPVPSELNWDRWLGPAPETPYVPERCHWAFRWWYEYSGGKLTDWGAHHVDIAQWAIGMAHSGPFPVEGRATFSQALKNGRPTRTDTYNTPINFEVVCKFPEDIEMVFTDRENGILFEGERGRFFVNRGKLTGTPVEELKSRPLPDGTLEELYGGQPGNHMGNFFACIASRKQPVSDVFSHHRTLSTCHIANLALRLARKLDWDAAHERFIGDDEADGWLARENREGYEIAD